MYINYFIAQSIYDNLDQIKGFAQDLKQSFQVVRYARLSMPTAGEVGFLLAAKNRVRINLYSILDMLALLCFPIEPRSYVAISLPLYRLDASYSGTSE